MKWKRDRFAIVIVFPTEKFIARQGLPYNMLYEESHDVETFFFSRCVDDGEHALTKIQFVAMPKTNQFEHLSKRRTPPMEGQLQVHRTNALNV